MAHDHHGHDHSADRAGNKKGLTIALVITLFIMAAELIGGLVTNSLALLSDAGHMLSDSSSLFLSLAAMWFAARPPSPKKTYGFYRFEILAAFFNGLTLFFMAGWIVYEAFERILQPPSVSSGTMIIIAAAGLAANLLSAYFLLKNGDVQTNVNMKSAYLHVLGDALGSIGAILAGVLMLAFNWYVADPIISVLVALLILKSAWGVLSDAIHILMEGTPLAINEHEVKTVLLSISGVKSVHDLHIWTITSGFDSLTCHLLIEDHQNEQVVLQQAINLIKSQFKITHTTIQIEKANLHHDTQQV